MAKQVFGINEDPENGNDGEILIIFIIATIFSSKTSY
jgi:hypothetical protein